MNKQDSPRTRPFFLLFIALLIFLTMAGCTGFPEKQISNQTLDRQDELSLLRETILKEMENKKITGLAIAVSDAEGMLWTEGFGSADKEKGIPFTDETISNVGSVSKLITAAAVARLAERGLIDLDDPVAVYIPEFHPRGENQGDRPITVRMLLNHESGLESDGFRDFFLGHEAPEDYPFSYRRAIEAVNQSGVVRDPYEIFSYCNLGYSLLGIIIERAMGTGFPQAVKELVFDPAGMADSTFILDDVPSERWATGYLKGKPQNIPCIRDMPAGSLNATARDMGSFLHHILASGDEGEGLLRPETRAALFAPSNTGVAADLDFQIGLTWWIVNLAKLPGENIVGHGGDLPPYHAMALVLPERNLSVFIMVNSVEGTGSFSLTDMAVEAVRTFTEIKGQHPIPVAEKPSPVIEIPEDLSETLPGYYASTAGLSEIRKTSRGLKIHMFGTWFDLYTHADNTLTVGKKILGIIPLNLPVFEELSISLETIHGAPALNLRIQGILISPAVKIQPAPVDPHWMSRCGSYESTQKEVMPHYTDFKIDLDKRSGFLCLYAKSDGAWTRFPLAIEDSARARLLGTGRSLGGMIESEVRDSGEILKFLNFELRKME